MVLVIMSDGDGDHDDGDHDDGDAQYSNFVIMAIPGPRAKLNDGNEKWLWLSTA